MPKATRLLGSLLLLPAATMALTFPTPPVDSTATGAHSGLPTPADDATDTFVAAAPSGSRSPQTVNLPLVGRPTPPLNSLAPIPQPLKAAAIHHLVATALMKPTLGPHAELAAARPGYAQPVIRVGGRGPVTPASLLKLFTLTTALEVLGTEHRFVTSVVRGSKPSDLILVGGGDPLLAVHRHAKSSASTYPPAATLAALARATSRRLSRLGIVRVHLQYDASLFRGPSVDPAWPRSYLRDNVVSRVSPLWVNEGRIRPGAVRRVNDPARAATHAFRKLLRGHGLRVSGPVKRATAAPDAAVLARVLSPPLSQIVQHTVSLSDNEGAEVLLRQVAVAVGWPGSFRGGVRTVRTTLSDMGLTLEGARFSDGSGLARSDRVPLQLLLDVLQMAASPGHPELSSLVSSLPVAGFSGSLTYRFMRGASAGLGVVRAKTGTLAGVHALAGVLTTTDGSALVFAVVADSAPVQAPLPAQSQIDRIAALLSTCRCRGH